MLAEDTIRSDSEHEGLHSDEMSEEEKENKQKKTKKEKTQFGSAKVIGGDQVPTKKVKKKRYTVGKMEKDNHRLIAKNINR